MGRIANSWEIVKASARVVRQDKELLVLPVLSFLASLVTLALVAGIGWKGGILPQVTDAAGHVKPLAFVLAGVVYLGLAIVNIYFAAAVVAGAAQRLAGSDPTLGSCLGAASRRFGRLFAWAAITATVSVLLQVIRERGGFAGRLFASLGALACLLVVNYIPRQRKQALLAAGLVAVLVVGLWGVITSRHLVHMVLCLSVMQASTYVLLLAVGFYLGFSAVDPQAHP
ncbi:MAG: DUF6159 family protein, partial [Thermoplasmatota archaeon]